MSVSKKNNSALYQQILHLIGLHAIRNLRCWTHIPVLLVVHLLAIQLPLRKREDIILLLNKVLGDEARCSF